jgi:hypothetical protein
MFDPDPSAWRCAPLGRIWRNKWATIGAKTANDAGPSRARDKAQPIRVWSIGDEGPQHHVNQAAGMLSRGESKTILICVAETFFPRSDDDNTDDDMGSDEFEERHGLTFPHSRFPIIRNCTVG